MSFKKKSCLRAVIGMFLLIGMSAQAAVVIGGTRVIYNGDKKEASVSISNPGKNDVYLVQSWIENNDNNNDKVPFIVTPPLFRMEPNEENILRIVRAGGTFPEDRESLFWLNVKSIPAMDTEKMENVLQVVVKSRIKLFYRPGKLPGLPIEAYKKLTFTRSEGKLQINNPTPYYITLFSLKVGSHEIKEADMVPPKGSVSYALPSGATGSVSWQTINDYGGISKVENRQL